MIEALCVIALSFGPFFFCGLVVQTILPRVALSGKWLWIFPVLVSLAIYGMVHAEGSFCSRVQSWDAWDIQPVS